VGCAKLNVNCFDFNVGLGIQIIVFVVGIFVGWFARFVNEI
jgi:hypothetical protein